MGSPRLAALELRRFGRGRLPRAALVALLVLPLLYGALYLWSFWDPYGRLDRIPAALVNEDRGTVADGREVAAGDDIAERLLGGDTFDWHEVDADEARRGVEEGTYYLSLTLPADFSERIASGGEGSAPETGALRVRTNDANNYVVGQISRTVFGEVRRAASTEASRGFLDRIFVSFSDIHDGTEEAASGADDLSSGIGKAEKGAADLADGLEDAHDGSGDLSDGVRRLHAGALDLEEGARQVAGGTGELAERVAEISGASPILAENERAVAERARVVAEAAASVRANLQDVAEGVPRAAEEARAAREALEEVRRSRCDTAEEVGDACEELTRAVDASGNVAGAAADLEALAAGHDRTLAELDERLAALRAEAEELALLAPRLSENLDDAVARIDSLNSGAERVAAGVGELRAGLATASTGAADLDEGVARLKSGADDLTGGIYRLVDGSTELAGGLREGAGRIPDYDAPERDRRTDAMSDPIRLVTDNLHAAPNYGTGFAPYFIPLSLWVGAMVAYMLVTPMNRRALAAGASPWRIALAGWLPVVAIGVAQTLALLAVLHWLVGLEMARTAGTVGFLFLVTACFTALVQWLNARFGAAGRILVLALLMLQLTSAGGTYPVQTSPDFFNALHPFLPMTHVVDALRRLITGGGLEPVWAACGVLALFTLGALALTTSAARRGQVWTLERLHPELTL
ncbi:YhgE/Pip family protein [Streptomyces sp. WMMC905]|uniref:YhgE/Pip family protein n=1 Tax=Streptomyces sp. WMMC905 TaxID=3404123 RepID=UPI003B967502